MCIANCVFFSLIFKVIYDLLVSFFPYIFNYLRKKYNLKFTCTKPKMSIRFFFVHWTKNELVNFTMSWVIDHFSGRPCFPFVRLRLQNKKIKFSSLDNTQYYMHVLMCCRIHVYIEYIYFLINVITMLSLKNIVPFG